MIFILPFLFEGVCIVNIIDLMKLKDFINVNDFYTCKYLTLDF